MLRALTAAALLISATAVSAETIRLTDGVTITAPVVKQTGSAVWVDLGRPEFLSGVRLYFLPFRLSRRAWRSMQRLQRPFS